MMVINFQSKLVLVGKEAVGERPAGNTGLVPSKIVYSLMDEGRRHETDKGTYNEFPEYPGLN